MKEEPGEVLRVFENPPNGNIAEVYNSILGMAYIAAENRLTLNDVYSCAVAIFFRRRTTALAGWVQKFRERL